MKKIIPAKKDYYIEQYKMNKAKSPEMFKAFLDEVNGKDDEIITGEIGATGPVDQGVDGKNVDNIKLGFKKAGKTPYDDMHKAITAYMEKHKVDYSTAMKHLKLLESPIEAEAEARKKMEAEEDKMKAEAGKDDGKKGEGDEEGLDEEEAEAEGEE
jgi:hypothetical protein